MAKANPETGPQEEKPAQETPKDKALREYRERLVRGKTEEKKDNGALVAGSPMYFNCGTCGCQDIVVPEDYVRRPDDCSPCTELKQNGWLTLQPS